MSKDMQREDSLAVLDIVDELRAYAEELRLEIKAHVAERDELRAKLATSEDLKEAFRICAEEWKAKLAEAEAIATHRLECFDIAQKRAEAAEQRVRELEVSIRSVAAGKGYIR